MWKIFKRKEKEITEYNKNPKIKIGIAFGGGGARGFVHVGALKAFEEAGIEFDAVAGTSAGSIMGAFYAAGYTSEQLVKVSKTIKAKDIRNSKLIFIPSSTTGIENLITNNIGNVNINSLKKPLAVVTVDLISGDEVIFTKGNLAKTVAGSCCFPGVFNPVEYEHMHLIDGGLQNNIPSDVLSLFDCDYVIAVDANPYRGGGTTSLKLMDVLGASLGIGTKSNSVRGYIYADMVIRPDTKRFKSTKAEGLDEMIEEGYVATKLMIPDILKLISKKPKRKNKKIFVQGEGVQVI